MPSIEVLVEETGSVPGDATFRVEKDAKIDWDLAHREKTEGDLHQLLVCERKQSAAEALTEREGAFLCAADSDVGFSLAAHDGEDVRSVIASVDVGVRVDPTQEAHGFAEPSDAR